MAKDALTIAEGLLKRRRFADVIKLLEGRSEFYEDNFEYYITLATACLYVGDIGTASTYYQYARRIKLTETRLLLGQAAIFLRRGDTKRALQYYLEVKENDPANKTANEAIEFVRTHGDYDTICRWVDSGKIQEYYPPLGTNPDKVVLISLPIAACVLGCILTVAFFPKGPAYSGNRANLSSIALSADEKSNSQEKNLTTQSYKYILSNNQITRSYEDALNYFQNHRDNAAQMEINRLLNSNATLSIKQKAQVLMGYLEEPTFDSLTDNPSYYDVEKEPELYLDCWVSWSGRISDALINNDGSYTCRLLVGYESMKNVDGIVMMKFEQQPSLEPDQPVRILAKISLEGKEVYLKGRAVYQSVHGGLKN